MGRTAVLTLALCGLALLAEEPTPAVAAGIACHCFRDREYDPARPAATDDYLLATAANSLLSAVSGMPKRAIVEARMSGDSGEDLWVSLVVARRSGRDRADLSKARAGAPSWAAALRSAAVPADVLGSSLAALVSKGASDAELARASAAEVLASRLGTPRGELDALASRGATLQETVLASLIGRWSERTASEVLTAAKAGGWSRLLAATGRVPRQMETEVPKSLRPELPAGAR